MAKILLSWLVGAGVLLLGQTAWAAGPCPDGNFNPQNRVCMCPGGGYVAPGNWCSSDGGKLEDAWGAIAIDIANGKGSGWGNSRKSQSIANQDALRACGLSTCRVIVTVKNSCAAVATDGKGKRGVGVDTNKSRALEKAAAACYAKGANKCYEWVPPSCANSPD